MKFARRFLVVLLGYACATFGAAILFLALTGLFVGFDVNWQPSELLYAFGFMPLITASYALPIALPVIAFTEIRNAGGWLMFASAGLFLGLLLAALFTEVPYRGINLELAATLIASSICGAMTYWLVVWRVFAPNHSTSNEPPTTEGNAT